MPVADGKQYGDLPTCKPYTIASNPYGYRLLERP